MASLGLKTSLNLEQVIRLWWYFQDTEFLITHRIPGKGYFVLGVSGYLLVNTNPLATPVQPLHVWLCSGTPRTSSSLCLSLQLYKPFSPSGCSKPVWQAALLQITTLTPLLRDKKLWKKCECRSCMLELSPGQKLPQFYTQRTLEGSSKAGTTFCLFLWGSRKVPLDWECNLLWGCVHSKQNMGSWASSSASFTQSVRKRTYIA